MIECPRSNTGRLRGFWRSGGRGAVGSKGATNLADNILINQILTSELVAGAGFCAYMDVRLG